MYITTYVELPLDFKKNAIIILVSHVNTIDMLIHIIYTNAFYKADSDLKREAKILPEHSLSLSMISTFHDPSEVQTTVSDVVGK